MIVKTELNKKKIQIETINSYQSYIEKGEVISTYNGNYFRTKKKNIEIDFSHFPNVEKIILKSFIMKISFSEGINNIITEINLSYNCSIKADLSIFSPLINLKILIICESDEWKNKEKINYFSGSLKSLENCFQLRCLKINYQKKITQGLEYIKLNKSSFFFSCAGTVFFNKLEAYGSDVYLWKLINFPDENREKKNELIKELLEEKKRKIKMKMPELTQICDIKNIQERKKMFSFYFLSFPESNLDEKNERWVFFSLLRSVIRITDELKKRNENRIEQKEVKYYKEFYLCICQLSYEFGGNYKKVFCGQKNKDFYLIDNVEDFNFFLHNNIINNIILISLFFFIIFPFVCYEYSSNFIKKILKKYFNKKNEIW